jgi:hypothetical protein
VFSLSEQLKYLIKKNLRLSSNDCINGTSIVIKDVLYSFFALRYLVLVFCSVVLFCMLLFVVVFPPVFSSQDLFIVVNIK